MPGKSQNPKQNLIRFRKPRWRKLLVVAFAALLFFVVGSNILSRIIDSGGKVIDTAGQTSFDKPLAIPPLAQSTTAPDGARVFDLKLQAGMTNFFDDRPTETWGVNQSYLGPTVRAKRGDKVRMQVTNALPETTSIHWHGMHLPARMDGGPHQPIERGSTWKPEWKIDQPAATLWYHPHPHGESEAHVYQGVAGMFILDDDTSEAANLPHSYGTDDLPVIIQDKLFDKNRQLTRDGSDSKMGLLGDSIMVNGVLTPHIDISTRLVRLRLLNASTARIYNLGMSDSRDMQLIATDGGLLEQPITKNRLMLSPGERAEVVVALQPGERVILRSHPLVEESVYAINGKQFGGQDTLDIMELRAKSQLAESPALPTSLAAIPHLSGSDATTTRRFKLTSNSSINNKKMDMNRIDLSVTRDTTEVWDVTNGMGVPHNFHVHGVQFQVMSLNGSTPPSEMTGWKDTVIVPPNKSIQLIMRFANYTDPNYPYMFHCHLLRHEDDGMMGQFVVVEPGQAAGSPPGHHGHNH